MKTKKTNLERFKQIPKEERARLMFIIKKRQKAESDALKEGNKK